MESFGLGFFRVFLGVKGGVVVNFGGSLSTVGQNFAKIDILCYRVMRSISVFQLRPLTFFGRSFSRKKMGGYEG